MSAHMKKHLTKVAIGKKEFNIPKKEAQAILSLVESIDQSTNDNGGTSSEVIFKEVAKNRPKGQFISEASEQEKILAKRSLRN